jgi:cellulose biosynthesis protein BcsQ
MQIFCVANQKGGVGKTTTTVNLAAGLAQVGQRVLIIDLDPQGNATMGSGIDKRALELSVYDVLLESSTIAEARQRTDKGGYDVLGATSSNSPAPRSSWSASSGAASACAARWWRCRATMTSCSSTARRRCRCSH